MLGIFLLAGCASGTNGPGPGRTDSGRRDAGPGLDAPGQDVTVRRDAAGGTDGSSCMDDTHPDECNLAAPMMVMTGDAPTVIMGFLPTLSGADWFAVNFPPMSGPNTEGMGSPSIVLEGDSTMIIEVRDGCDATLPVVCGEGNAREATSYTFLDDQSMPGEADGDGSDTYTSRDTPWPETLVVRVGRRGGPASCAPYTLTISR